MIDLIAIVPAEPGFFADMPWLHMLVSLAVGLVGGLGFRPTMARLARK